MPGAGQVIRYAFENNARFARVLQQHVFLVGHPPHHPGTEKVTLHLIVDALIGTCAEEGQ